MPINRSKEKRLLISLSDEDLCKIISDNHYVAIQKILGVSSFVWKEELRKRNIPLKNQLRINKYPELTLQQIRLIIGSLLGDGGIEDGSKKCARYFEAHAPNQYLYLKNKHVLLRPFSCNIYIDEAYRDLFCYKFTTISHPCFKRFWNAFYEPGLEGKLIPLDLIKFFWHDDILVYWFLDDGHFDSKSGCYTIANKCPKPEQLYSLLNFLSDYYQVSFTLYKDPDLFNVKLPLKFRERFIQMILRVTTEDMLYKIPNSDQRELKSSYQLPMASGSSRIADIKNKITLGYTLEELKREYPITRALFKKLGGVIPQYITMNHPLVREIVGDGKIPSQSSPLDTDIIIGTVLGDGNIYNYGHDTCIFSLAHSTPQISYVQLKYELLKFYVNRVLYLKNTTNDFYSFHVLLQTLPIFFDLYKIFYTAEKVGKSHLQKDLFKEEIINMLNPRVFAFWIMDDGKKYGSGKYMFTITIGKQPYYKFRDFQKFVGLLNDKLGINMRAREEKISYEITTTPGEAEDVFYKIKDYIWPYFSYKFGVSLADCGQVYRDFPWYSKWEKRGFFQDVEE